MALDELDVSLSYIFENENNNCSVSAINVQNHLNIYMFKYDSIHGKEWNN